MSEKTLNNLRTIPENPVKAGCDGGILVNNNNDKVGTFIIAGGTASVRISCKSGTFTFVNSSLDEACKAAKACYDKEIAPLEAERADNKVEYRSATSISGKSIAWKGPDIQFQAGTDLSSGRVVVTTSEKGVYATAELVTTHSLPTGN